MATASVNPEKILRDLRELWVDLGKHQEVPGGVLRACSMTLLTIADSSAGASADDLEGVHQLIGILMHQHPSRAIVIAPQEGAELSARVFSECWMPYHSRQQICAEGIEIVADSQQMDEVARLLMALIVADLPVVLWCRGPRAFLDRTLDPLFPLARKIIFDTGAARHAPSAIEFVRRLRKEGRWVADLAWTRLTGWRETIASVFDSHIDPKAPTGATLDPGCFGSIRVLHGGPRPGSEAMYMARWIDRTCPGANVLMAAVDEPAGLRGVIFANPEGEVSIRRVENCFEVRVGKNQFTSAMPQCSEEINMREELSILDRDPAFDRVLA